jgi:hypothetical protein
MAELFGQINPALLLGMIPGLTQFLKELTGLEGKWATALTFFVSFALAFGFQAQELLAVINPWVQVSIYSITFALTGAGYYKLIGVAAAKFRS